MHLLEPFILGVLTGIISSISFGPALLTITETSMKRGPLQGALVAIGISMSDIMYVTLLTTGLISLINNDLWKSIIGLAGGLLLLLFGLSLFRKRTNTELKEIKTQKGPLTNIIKGFLVNTLNPYVPFYWAGIVAIASTRINNEFTYQIFFAGVLGTMILIDILKSWLASKAGTFSSLNYGFIYKIVCGLLLLIGAQMLFYAVSSFATGKEF